MANKADITNAEEWRDIPGWEGFYQASSLGRVRSLPRAVNGKLGSRPQRAGRVLKPYTIWSGYDLVKLHSPGAKKGVGVHRLVALSFLGDRPVGYEVNHLNGIRNDNRLSNLEWATRSENCQHKHVTGTVHLGEDHPNSKLTNEQVRHIRNTYAGGYGEMKALEEKYGMSRTALWQMLKGITYSTI